MYKKSVTDAVLEFLKEYPLSAKEVLFTPIIYRSGLSMPDTVPTPSLNGIKDLARFAGISDSALRTALSRAKADGQIIERKDESGKSRFSVSASTFELGLDTVSRGQKQEGFTLAVFSFTKTDEKERSIVRELLKGCGFKRLAQNTYINGRIDTTHLMASIKTLGLAQHLYFFHCPDIDDPDLIEKILKLFDLQERAKQLEQFYAHMTAFLDDFDLSEIELGRRLLYFGAIYWTVCEVLEPPIPLKYLPVDYPMTKIKASYHDFVEKNKDKLIHYYISVNT